jgi:senataxin
LVEKNVQDILNEDKNFQNGELEEKESELSSLTIKANSLERDKNFEELKHVKQRMNVVRNQIGYLEKYQRKRSVEKRKIDTEMTRKKLRIELLSKSDVILTTLSSCSNSTLLQVFNYKRIFNCCIIDEASQCTEPEILMPLSFNSINKMILIGDPMQLPATIISTTASKYGFGRSLFERFYQYLQTKPGFNQFYIMLNIQYRMHKEICALPSRLFYKNRLLTDNKPNQRRFPLVPYLVFDVKDTIECKKNVKNIHNSLESNFVVKLANKCTEILEQQENLSNYVVKVGIITPYQGQRKLLEDSLRRCNSQRVMIEVNTSEY